MKIDKRCETTSGTGLYIRYYSPFGTEQLELLLAAGRSGEGTATLQLSKTQAIQLRDFLNEAVPE